MESAHGSLAAMSRIHLFALVSVTVLLGGCGVARVVHRSQSGGVIAIEGDRNKAMEQAHQLMAEHCRGPYQITEEGEHVVGTDRAESTDTYVTEEGEVVETTGESTREATEWRVRYTCGNAPAGAPGEGPDEGAPPEGDEGPPPEGDEGGPPPEGDEGAPPEGDPAGPPPGEPPPAEGPGGP